MKLLKDILYKVNLDLIHGDSGIGISHLCFDSRQVQKGSLFIAINGTLSDGHDFIEMAINSGASAIVCEKLPLNIDEAVVYVLVKDSSKALEESFTRTYTTASLIFNGSFSQTIAEAPLFIAISMKS